MNYRKKKLHVYLLHVLQSAQGMQGGWGYDKQTYALNASEAVYIRGNVLDIVWIREWTGNCLLESYQH